MDLKYHSTRGKTRDVEFLDAVMMGMASDGGLLLPQEFPQVANKLQEWAALSYVDLAFEVMKLYVTDVPSADLKSILEKSYGTFRHQEVTPIKALKNEVILELFHGPTLAFKDVALQFLGEVFDYALKKRGGHLNILGATSGDTGSAAIAGVRGKGSINIFVMHPKGRTSPIQELQMTSILDQNVHNMAIDGTFDDCQHILKTLFNDLEFKQQYHLGAVNSVNWARILAQVVYYFYAYFRVEPGCQEKRTFVVPTGNFGDIFAGYVAASMGLPVEQLTLATNENNILERFFNTGVYERGAVVHSISPSMDIQVASNFERYLYSLLQGDHERLVGLMKGFAEGGRIEFGSGPVPGLIKAGSGSTQETLKTIQDVYKEDGYLLDPHTAVGVGVSRKLRQESGSKTKAPICLATAHPSKFPQDIADLLGPGLATHPEIDQLEGLPTRCHDLPNDAQKAKEFVKERA